MTDEIKDPQAVLAALERAKEDAKKYREQAEALEAQLAEANTQIESLSGNQQAFTASLIDAEAKARLLAQGIKEPERFLKYLDREKVMVVEVDGKPREFDGLEEAITSMKGDFPEVFEPKRRVGNQADAFADNPASRHKTASERQAEQLQGV